MNSIFVLFTNFLLKKPLPLLTLAVSCTRQERFAKVLLMSSTIFWSKLWKSESYKNSETRDFFIPIASCFRPASQNGFAERFKLVTFERGSASANARTPSSAIALDLRSRRARCEFSSSLALAIAPSSLFSVTCGDSASHSHVIHADTTDFAGRNSRQSCSEVAPSLE